MQATMGALHEFTATQQIFGNDGNTGLAYDESRKQICLLTRNPLIGDYRSPLAVTTRIIGYKDILSVELSEDGTTVTKTARLNQAVGMLVGGFLLGGAGALIGGLSGKTVTSAGKVKRIDIRLLVNDEKNPIHDINFMNIEVKKGGLIYVQAMKQARHWHCLIEVLIKQADAQEKVPLPPTTSPMMSVPPSIADELKKLGELRDAGILSNDEFLMQKSKMLSTN